MTTRNVLAVGVFLFGTTFLWLTPAMAGKESDLTGAGWVLVQVLAWSAIVGFTAAAWAVFKALDWWWSALAASAVVGVAATAVYLVAARGAESVVNVASNGVIHAGVSAVILAAVATPALRDGIAHRL